MTHKPVLETARLILRKPEPRDADGFIAFLASGRGRFVGGPATAGKAWRAFASILGHWDMRGYGMFAVTLKDTGETIGNTGPWFPGDWPEPELSWAIWSADHEGKGYATEAAQAVREYMADVLEIYEPVSYIDAGNARSIALAERLGATPDPHCPAPFETAGEGVVYRHPSPDQIGGDGGMEAYA